VPSRAASRAPARPKRSASAARLRVASRRAELLPPAARTQASPAGTQRSTV